MPTRVQSRGSTMEAFAKFIDALANLVGALVWPAVVIFILLRYQESFNEFFRNLGEFTVKFPGVEAAAKLKQTEAAAALAAAAVTRTDAGTALSPDRRPATREVATVVARTATPRTLRRLAGAQVLWVDDRPANNRYEREALEALGIGFTLATSTDDALERLRHGMFDLIISDMGRPPDAQAGYSLLGELRRSGDRTPYIIYAGSRARVHRAEARQLGALDCTNDPNELFELVTTTLARRG